MITEESGIAKGIRRVIAVTGAEAKEAIHSATSLATRLGEVEKLKGSLKADALKAFSPVRTAVPIR